VTMTQTSRTMLALFVTLPAAACMTGPSAQSFDPVRQAKGVQLEVSGKKAAVRGELLEVRENELVVLENLKKKGSGAKECVMTLVAFRQVRNVAFKGTSVRWGGGMPSESERAQLRLLSRFPTGITPAMMQELTTACSQPAEVTL
jgi:hypothetical protein